MEAHYLSKIVLEKNSKYKYVFGLKKAVITFLAFLVPFTQIVSYPVAYAVNTVIQPRQIEGNSNLNSSSDSSPSLKSVFDMAKSAVLDVAEAAVFGGGDVKKASAPNKPEKIYDLVALVVETEFFADIHSYVGLRSDYPGLRDTTLRDRIVRYAEDIVDNNELMDVKFLFFDKDKDTVQELYAALENMYVNGDGTHNNRLAGAVFIGDIPFPVVNKNGNRFASIFPYTDFTDSVYSYNEDTKSFERNQGVEFPKAEIWHGVIKAPEEGTIGRNALAGFFDKNHLFYEGEPDFANFEKKIFFSDLIHEKERINKDVYQYYLRYLDGMEDLAYMRYNKFWANEVTNAASGSLGDALAESDILTEQGEEFFEMTGGSGGITAQLPDVQSKTAIDQSLQQYYQLLTKYISEVNDWVQYTGRYFRGDVDHTPGLITMKDEYSMLYLKSANDAIEKQINAIAEKLDEPLPILKYTELSGSFGNTGPFQIRIGEEENLITGLMEPVTISTLVMRYPFYNEENGKYYLNGIPLDDVAGPKQCSVYLGSTKSEYFDEDLNFNPKKEL